MARARPVTRWREQSSHATWLCGSQSIDVGSLDRLGRGRVHVWVWARARGCDVNL